jgi:class 3 adenylate cyclase
MGCRLSRNTGAVRDVEVEFAVRDGTRIAFEVFGRGPIDLVVMNGGRFPIDLMWDLPQLAEFMDTLGTVARVITFDRSGSGASDPMPTTDGAAGMENTTADVLAVMDAAGCERPSLFDFASGATTLFQCAMYPERVRSLVIAHLRTSFPEMRGFTTEQRKKMAQSLATTRGLRSDNPRVGHDTELQRWWGRARRLVNNPDGIALQMEYASQIDVESVLEHVRAPTLVLHRSDNPLWDIETSRAAAARIPNSRFVEVPGSEVDIFLGDTAPVLAEVTQFLRQQDTTVANDDRALVTVLFTDMVASTEHLAARGDDAWRHMLDDHDQTMSRIVGEYRGNVVKTTGDGILATFDGPARAVRCAAVLLEAANQQGITLRAGLHTGEIELRPADVAGIAVHIASRISSLANAGEILVSRTVVDLTAGSAITYTDRGDHQLKGVPGSMTIFAAQTPG